MLFYTGKTADGSDMKEVQGMYINPDNPDEWSNNPYPMQPYPMQQKMINIENDVLDYMSEKNTLDNVYKQIIDNKCNLSKRLRDYVLTLYDSNYIYKDDE